MPKALPAEFRQRAVDLARTGDVPVAQIARDLGISEPLSAAVDGGR
jgi:transposase-like protein